MDNETEVRLITDLRQIRKIHKEHLVRDFPENETTPWVYMRQMLQKGEYACYGFFRKTEFLGYAFFIIQKINGKTYYLWDYLAIADGFRNQGYGSAFLSQIDAVLSHADCVVFEVEDPEAASDEEERSLRMRRIRLYERNGFHVTEARCCFRDVVYRLGECPTGAPFHTEDELREIYFSIYRQIVPEPILKKMFKML